MDDRKGKWWGEESFFAKKIAFFSQFFPPNP